MAHWSIFSVWESTKTRLTAYEKILLNQTNFDQTLPQAIRSQAQLATKDEYAFDFLELGEAHSERQLEQAILSRVEPFLQEMGGMFTFVGSQYRLGIGNQEYFIGPAPLPPSPQMPRCCRTQNR